MTDTDELRISDEARADLAEAVLAVGSNEHAARFLRAEAATPWTNALAQVDAVLAAALPLIESELRAEVERLTRIGREDAQRIGEDWNAHIRKNEQIEELNARLSAAEAALATERAEVQRLRAAMHVPQIVQRRDGNYGVICAGCSWAVGDYVQECSEGSEIPRVILAALGDSVPNPANPDVCMHCGEPIARTWAHTPHGTRECNRGGINSIAYPASPETPKDAATGEQT